MAKELHTAAANFSLVPEDGSKPAAGGFRPMVELILTVSEPRYGFDETGGTVRSRGVETIRIHAGPAALRAVAKMCGEWADLAEQMAKLVPGDAQAVG